MLQAMMFSMLWNWIWQGRHSQLLTLWILWFTMILFRRVLGAMVMLKLSSSEGPDPDAQADRSPEPDMADSQVVPEVRPSARTQAGFAALDLINVRDIFTQRACVMKVPPAFLRGACRSAMRTALSEITSGMALRNNTRVVREDALVQASRGGKVPKNALLDRFTKFAQGQWLDLLTQSVAASASAIEMRSRRRRTGTDSVEKRAERAEALICFG